jgi:predicted dehydrogenase
VKRAAARAAKYGIPRSGDLATVLAMPKVELIVNLTIPQVHASVALQAIRARKHVYGEKPFALSVQEAQAVMAAAKESGVQLGNAPDTFLGASLQTARRLIEEGRIGTPLSAKATFGYPGPDAWHPSPEFLFQKGGGPLLDMGPYYLTALVQLFGPVKTVSGFSSRAQDKRVIGSGPRVGESFGVFVDTQVSALLKFTSGPVATATFSFDAPIATRELEVSGTDAIIRLPDPNSFDGSTFLCRKDMSKAAPDEWLEAPAESDWVEVQAEGSAEGAAWVPWIRHGRRVPAGNQERGPIWLFTCWTLWSPLPDQQTRGEQSLCLLRANRRNPARGLEPA